ASSGVTGSGGSPIVWCFPRTPSTWASRRQSTCSTSRPDQSDRAKTSPTRGSARTTPDQLQGSSEHGLGVDIIVCQVLAAARLDGGEARPADVLQGVLVGLFGVEHDPDVVDALSVRGHELGVRAIA